MERSREQEDRMQAGEPEVIRAASGEVRSLRRQRQHTLACGCRLREVTTAPLSNPGASWCGQKNPVALVHTLGT